MLHKTPNLSRRQLNRFVYKDVHSGKTVQHEHFNHSTKMQGTSEYFATSTSYSSLACTQDIQSSSSNGEIKCLANYNGMIGISLDEGRDKKC